MTALPQQTPQAGRRARAIPGSGIRALAAAAWADPDAVHLEFGEPTQPTAAHIVQAADQAARAGHTRYGPTAGLPDLRAAITHKLSRDNGWPPTPAEQVVVTAGGVGALFAAYRTILDDGDEVLVPDPGWPNFVALAHTVGATPVPYQLDPSTGMVGDPTVLDRLVTPRTRALVINSPGNPTGATWTPDALTAMASWASARGLWIVSDECYDQLGLDGAPSSVQACLPDAPVITVFSLSKSYAMTGWRVGYAVVPPSLVPTLTRVQEATASCVNTVAQHAGIAALLGPQDGVAAMRDGYRQTRDAAVAAAQRAGLAHVRPTGAFYLWVQLPPTVSDDERFAYDLLASHSVAVAPGSAFGRAGRGHVRLSLAAAPEEVLSGLTAIGCQLSELTR